MYICHVCVLKGKCVYILYMYVHVKIQHIYIYICIYVFRYTYIYIYIYTYTHACIRAYIYMNASPLKKMRKHHLALDACIGDMGVCVCVCACSGSILKKYYILVTSQSNYFETTVNCKHNRLSTHAHYEAFIYQI